MCSVRTILESEGNELLRPDGSSVVAGGGLSLASLSPTASPAEYLDEVDVNDSENPAPPPLQDDPAYSPTVYGRVLDDGRDGCWLQYWFWLYYNQKRMFGIGAHEGDWEMIQIHLARDGAGDLEPTHATFAQHNGGEAKSWGANGMTFDERDGRLVVFVAPFSHASYYGPGTQFYMGGTDSPDELGPRVLPEVEPFGPWASWPGHWGGSHGRFRRSKRRSPASPACQGAKWARPGDFHRISLGLKPGQKVLRGVWVLGHLTYPRQPEITTARIEGDVVSGQVEKSSWFRRGSHLYLTAHTLKDGNVGGDLVGGPVVARNAGAKHEFVIELRARVDRCCVYATAYNLLRQTSFPARHEAARTGV